MVSLRFADGSLAAIAYGSAAPVAGKEWIEIQAGSHRVVIDDFRSVQAGRQDGVEGPPGQGASGRGRAFRQAVAGGPAMPTETLLATMRAILRVTAKAPYTGNG